MALTSTRSSNREQKKKKTRQERRGEEKWGGEERKETKRRDATSQPQSRPGSQLGSSLQRKGVHGGGIDSWSVNNRAGGGCGLRARRRLIRRLHIHGAAGSSSSGCKGSRGATAWGRRADGSGGHQTTPEAVIRQRVGGRYGSGSRRRRGTRGRRLADVQEPRVNRGRQRLGEQGEQARVGMSLEGGMDGLADSFHNQAVGERRVLRELRG